jgi:Protein of unknown function (DUF3631)/Domain of unknown function (DUF3854)
VTLAEHHRAMLEASAITADVIAERGYRTGTKRTELADLGYATNQRPVPALIVPQHGVTGGIVGYQIRPDTPMVVDGKIWKYVSPKGSEVRLSVPPRCRPFLRRAITPLFVVEGDKKADSLATRGLCAISVAGVDCWNVPQDWAKVALDGRTILIAYDNDVTIKPSVHGALGRLRHFLTANGAIVQIVYLPDGDDGKVGVDDFLAAGHAVEELYELAEDELREPPAEPAQHRPAWPTGVLLHDIEQQLARFVQLDQAGHESAALALFVLHTWAFKAAAATPYLYVKSPQKRSGKTRLLELLAELCRHPLRASSVTEAAIFQAVEKWKPTLLVDEVDAIFYGRSERAEALRLVLDAGNRPGSPVVRGTQDGEPKLFETYCPKALAGIDRGLPDTIRDRAVVIAMERKLRGDRVERFRRRDVETELGDLRGRFEDWAAEHAEALAEYRFAGRLNVSDRLEEAWEPLLAVADLAGDGWPQRARKAAEALAQADAGNETADDGHTLLVALRAIFTKHKALHSKTICHALNADDELPFHDYRKGSGIDGNGLGRLLKPYGIRSERVWVGTERARGYLREQFAEAWKRYARDGDAAPGPSRPSTRPPDAANDGAEPNAGWTGGGRVPVPDPSTPETAAQSQNGRPVDGWTGGTAEVQPPAHAHATGNGRAPAGEEPCQYEQHRATDWRLRGGGPWVCGVCHPPTAQPADLVEHAGAL